VALDHPSPAPFSIVLFHPTPTLRPKEFCLFFTILAATALAVGQSRRMVKFIKTQKTKKLILTCLYIKRRIDQITI
jgi:hypothetical protein